MCGKYEASQQENNWTRCLLRAVDDSHIPYSAEASGDFGRAQMVIYYGSRKATIHIRQNGSKMVADSTLTDGKHSVKTVRTWDDLVKTIDATIPADMPIYSNNM